MSRFLGILNISFYYIIYIIATYRRDVASIPIRCAPREIETFSSGSRPVWCLFRRSPDASPIGETVALNEFGQFQAMLTFEKSGCIFNGTKFGDGYHHTRKDT